MGTVLSGAPPSGFALDPEETGLVSEAIGLTMACGLLGSFGDKFGGGSTAGGGRGGEPVTI